MIGFRPTKTDPLWREPLRRCAPLVGTPSEIRADSSGPQSGTAASEGGNDDFGALTAHCGYFQYQTFEFSGHQVILGSFRANLYNAFTERADHSLHHLMHYL
jgi:hypothetical protein